MTTKTVPVAALCLFVNLAGAATLRPSETETASEVQRTRALAMQYTRQMPDFLCIQTVRRFRRLTLPKTWQALDVLRVKLHYSGQAEDREIAAREGLRGLDDFGGMENIGEFGGMLETLFDPASQAVFHWEEWRTVRGRPAAAYSYRVERAHSAYGLTFDPGYAHQTLVGYRGTVVIDRETGGVLQLAYTADDIPAGFPLQYASTTIDYDFVEIAGRRYLMPVHSESEIATDGATLRSRNVAEFGNYQKFSTDSAIQFGDTVEKQ